MHILHNSVREASRTQHFKKNVLFHTSDYSHSADSLKNVFEIPSFFDSQFSGGNTRKLRVFFLHTNAALELRNRVQFALAKLMGRPMEAAPLLFHRTPNKGTATIPMYTSVVSLLKTR